MKADQPVSKVTDEAGAARPARVLAFPSPWEPGRKTAGIGVGIACAAMSMWYLPLFAAVLRARLVHHDWPPASALASTLPWGVAAIGAALASAAALTLAARGVAALGASEDADAPHRRHFVLRFASESWPTILVGSAGLAATGIALHYRTLTSLAEAGLDLRSGPAGSVLFGLVALDLVALGIATAALVVMTIRLALGKWHPAKPLPLALWSVYLRCAAYLASAGFLASFVAT